MKPESKETHGSAEGPVVEPVPQESSSPGKGGRGSTLSPRGGAEEELEEADDRAQSSRHLSPQPSRKASQTKQEGDPPETTTWDRRAHTSHPSRRRSTSTSKSVTITTPVKSGRTRRRPAQDATPGAGHRHPDGHPAAASTATDVTKHKTIIQAGIVGGEEATTRKE